jgi:NAD(P)-dependent dehydrogenase (short-subunit alcohol dehydrogenase family)
MTNGPTDAPGELLRGRVALVTGGGRGIGRAVARALAEHGARLVINDLGCARDGSGRDPGIANEAALELRRAGFEAIASPHDVTVKQEVMEMVALADGYGEPIDLLVNCAGILKNSSLLDLPEDDFTAVVRTDLLGTLLVTQVVASTLKQARRRGSIVNMTSISGLLGNLGQANESAAKAGVYGLTRTSAIELQKFGITVNAVAAIARTRLTEDLPMFEKVRGTLEPEHVAPAVVFLASELCEGLSGVVLSVAGGRLSTISLVESQGRLKDEADGHWTPQEIAEHFGSIARK